MMSDDTHNGYANYETWLVALWLDGEQGAYEYWQTQGKAAWFRAGLEKHGWCAQSTSARINLRTTLHECIRDEHPLNDKADVWSDLLGAALRRVDWFEIADNILDGCEIEGYESR